MSSINYDLRKIKAFLFDVDGVLSKDAIAIYPNGEPVRTMNIKDGYAMQLAVKTGYQVGIITGGNTEAVRIRFTKLGLQHIYMSSHDKTKDMNDFLNKTGLSPDEVIYVGDDIPDYKVMQMVGLPIAPKNAAHEIRAIAKYISLIDGGEGVARDIIEQTMKAQDKWMGDEAFCW